MKGRENIKRRNLKDKKLKQQRRKRQNELNSKLNYKIIRKEFDPRSFNKFVKNNHMDVHTYDHFRKLLCEYIEDLDHKYYVGENAMLFSDENTHTILWFIFGYYTELSEKSRNIVNKRIFKCFSGDCYFCQTRKTPLVNYHSDFRKKTI